MKVKIYNLERKEVGDLELSDDVFGADVKEHLLHEVVTAQRATRRAGTQATKERSAVRGTNKKIYRQKGTGRARQGGARAPHRVGGGPVADRWRCARCGLRATQARATCDYQEKVT